MKLTFLIKFEQILRLITSCVLSSVTVLPCHVEILLLKGPLPSLSVFSYKTSSILLLVFDGPRSARSIQPFTQNHKETLCRRIAATACIFTGITSFFLKDPYLFSETDHFYQISVCPLAISTGKGS